MNHARTSRTKPRAASTPPRIGSPPRWRMPSCIARRTSRFWKGPRIPTSWWPGRPSWAIAALAITDRNSWPASCGRMRPPRQVGLEAGDRRRDHARSMPRRSCCWTTDRAAYGRLSRLITVGRRRAAKGECQVSLADVAAMPRACWPASSVRPASWPIADRFGVIANVFGDRCYLLAELHRGPTIAERSNSCAELARAGPAAAGGRQRRALSRRRAPAAGTTCSRPFGSGCTVAERASGCFPTPSGI